MDRDQHQKVTSRHLKRDAYLYVRQSTLRQVLENTESTHRQYALRERALALGWTTEQVVTIDDDLGQSGASTVGRNGFQRLVSDVSMGQVGIVLGLEVSRLARCSSDWCRLLEICALTDTLILDEDGLYDPNSFNDRLLLGLKGTMSEAELHFLKMRMRGGVLSKARRGELKVPLPAGFVYGPGNQCSSIRTARCRISCNYSFRPSGAPEQPQPRSSFLETRRSLFLIACVQDRTGARSPGISSPTIERVRSSGIPAMPELFSSDEHAGARGPAAIS
jgi:DNA invertase Pin-like site-specific DNA recombinase